REFFMLNILGFTIIYLIIGVTGFSWGLLELATLFFSMAILIGIGLGKTPNQITQSFMAGAKDILSAALVVALAGGIIVILEDGKIIDTILYSISNSIQGAGKISSLSLMYLFQSAMNAIITSGTAKAALLMPILRDVSDMIGLSQQATVTAFHIGDGFTNLITPTSGVLIGVLEVARIPFVKWFKWAWKFILMMVILGWLLLIPTVTIPLNGF
ncbi:MAG: YfcC family protein, partial [Bacteroidales bacterium]|nr:YfcC family protein [Bacteroidales bacterium]